MFCTMYDTESTGIDRLHFSQLIEVYLSLKHSLQIPMQLYHCN